MFKRLVSIIGVLAIALWLSPASADEYQDTINVFKKAGESGTFSSTAYGYAVFPTIGKGGVGVGGAYGKGRVYEKGKYVGNTSMAQVTVGLQLGGEAYSEIIFFQDERAFKEFTNGNFEFGADAQAVAHHRECQRQGEFDGCVGRRERHQEQGRDGRRISQGHGDLHRGQGWIDV